MVCLSLYSNYTPSQHGRLFGKTTGNEQWVKMSLRYAIEEL